MAGGIGLGMSSEALIAQDRCAKAPNDPKLSDGGGWRDGCTVGGKAVVEAASVTAGAVRCSAWLGVAVGMEKTLKNEDKAEVDDGSVAEWKHEPLK